MARRRSRCHRNLLRLLVGLALVRCTPDFASLSSGPGGRGGAAGAAPVGVGNAGTSEQGGSSSGGSASGGKSTSGGANDGGGAGEPELGTAGSEASGGALGEGGAPAACTFLQPAATIYTAFTDGLNGPGFELATTTTSIGSTLGATAKSSWDASAGNTCPGALHLEALFKGYASGSASDEVVNMDLRFAESDWTGVVALHAWVKVQPAVIPLRGVQLFVISGDSFLYASVFEESAFDGGAWHEMILPLKAGATFDPGSVQRVGLQVVLDRAGVSGNPASPPPIDVWLDDVWVEN